MGTMTHHPAAPARALLCAAAVLLFTAATATAQSKYAGMAAPEMLAALRTAPARERADVADAIVARRNDLLPGLRAAATGGSPADRFLACTLLAELRDRDGVDALVAATADPDVRVRRRAATSLRLLGDPRAASRMRALLRSETDTGVLKTALATLGRVGRTADRSRIAPFLEHGNESVRVTAAGSLAMLGDESALDAVLLASHSIDPGAQKTAVFALGLFADARAGERLAAILADPHGPWKAWALVAEANRSLRGRDAAARATALEALAFDRRSRTLAEWAVDELSAEDTPEAAAALQRAGGRGGLIGDKAGRRARIRELAR